MKFSNVSYDGWEDMTFVCGHSAKPKDRAEEYEQRNVEWKPVTRSREGRKQLFVLVWVHVHILLVGGLTIVVNSRIT